MNDSGMDKVAMGAEASRRQAWARFYQEKKDKERLLEVNARLMREIAELCILVTEDEALCVFSEDSRLVKRACSILGTLRLRPRGRQAIDEAREVVKQ